MSNGNLDRDALPRHLHRHYSNRLEGHPKMKEQPTAGEHIYLTLFGYAIIPVSVARQRREDLRQAREKSVELATHIERTRKKIAELEQENARIRKNVTEVE